MKKSFALTALLSVMACLTVVAQTPITPEQALNKLKEGNQRFCNNQSVHGNLTHERMIETDKQGQHPYATILGCSDSRVPVEAIFDAGIGEIFVVRVAGNVVDTHETGSIEYGVGHAHTPVLVVLGHSHCGAVTAVAQHAHVDGSIKPLVKNIKTAVEEAQKSKGKEFNEEMLEEAIRCNVWLSVKNVLEQSKEVRHLVKEEKLKVVGAYYHIHDGSIEWMGEHPSQKELVK